MNDPEAQLAQLFEIARKRYSPDDRALAMLRNRLEAKLGPKVARSSAAVPVSESALSGKLPWVGSRAAKLIGVGLVAAVIGLTIVWFIVSSRPERRAFSLPPSPAPLGGSTDTAGAEPIGAQGPRPQPSASSSLPEKRARVKPRTGPVRAHHARPTPIEHSASRPSIAAGREPNLAISETPPESTASSSEDTLAFEIAMLRNARSAMDRGDPAAALDVLDRYAQQHPQGTLRQERLATRVLALCALGRTDDARSTAEQLARIAPGSPHLLRLRTSCIGRDVK